MTSTRIRALVVAVVVVVAGCQYVVIPPEASTPIGAGSKGWTALPTSVGPGASGDFRIELTLRNETGAWSAMAAADKPAVLTSEGKTTDCATVKVGTGGHRIAPGLQLRGYQTGSLDAPTTELIRVECPGAAAGPGAKLAIDYSYVTGEYNYYDPDSTKTDAKLEVALDPLATGLQYPIAEPVDGLVKPADTPITAINDLALKMTAATRTADGLELGWEATNPSEYPSSVHIGLPPVIGSDGIVYGVYESPDVAEVPTVPAGGSADWTTTVAVPSDVSGLHVLLSVETRKARTFVNYLLDLTGK